MLAISVNIAVVLEVLLHFLPPLYVYGNGYMRIIMSFKPYLLQIRNDLETFVRPVVFFFQSSTFKEFDENLRPTPPQNTIHQKITYNFRCCPDTLNFVD